MTMLEAAIQVLKDRQEPMAVADIYEAITSQSLFTFGAKNPRAVLSGTLRKHAKKNPSPLIVEASPGHYRLTT